MIGKTLILFILFFPNDFGLNRIQRNTPPNKKSSTLVKKAPLIHKENLVKLKKKSAHTVSEMDIHALIQIQADKDHGVFVSLEQTSDNERKARQEFAFSAAGAYRILDDKLQNRDEDIERWSKELARYRFARNDEEKLFLIKDLLNDAVDSRDYTKVDHLINCDSLKFMNFSTDVLGSFHPTVYVEDGILFGGDDSDAMNIRMQKEIEKLQKRIGAADLRGVLYAWNSHEGLLQYCDVYIPH